MSVDTGQGYINAKTDKGKHEVKGGDIRIWNYCAMMLYTETIILIGWLYVYFNRDGVNRSGLYCVIASLIERLKSEHDVATSQTVDQLRRQKQDIIPNAVRIITHKLYIVL